MKFPRFGKLRSRFIHDFTFTKPLRDIKKKNVRWNWSAAKPAAFEKNKWSISSQALSYFDPTLTTEVTIDANPVGLAAIMVQYDPNKSGGNRLVLYASKSLSNVQQKCSQVEREALAVVCACKRVHVYLYSSGFDMITDNKTVQLIYGNPQSKSKARIKIWSLRLLAYNYKIIHKPRAMNIADYMSGNPTFTLNK